MASIWLQFTLGSFTFIADLKAKPDGIADWKAQPDSIADWKAQPDSIADLKAKPDGICHPSQLHQSKSIREAD